jgi:hypothetical protein
LRYWAAPAAWLALPKPWMRRPTPPLRFPALVMVLQYSFVSLVAMTSMAARRAYRALFCRRSSTSPLLLLLMLLCSERPPRMIKFCGGDVALTYTRR